MFKSPILENKIAFVTGGARGIGKAITLQLAEEGATVIFSYCSSEEKAKALVSDAEKRNLKINAIKLDIRDKTAVDTVIPSMVEQYGQIDILVNNSGIIRDNLLVGFTEEDIKAVFDTNILGMFYVTQAITPYMMRRRSGKIINISSVAGLQPGRGQSNYAATKGAVNAFTKALAVELAPRNIQVNAIAPGVIETDISKEVRDLAAEEALGKILLKRFGQAEEIAYTVAFLASPYGNYINGQIIAVDGGFKMA